MTDSNKFQERAQRASVPVSQTPAILFKGSWLFDIVFLSYWHVLSVTAITGIAIRSSFILLFCKLVKKICYGLWNLTCPTLVLLNTCIVQSAVCSQVTRNIVADASLAVRETCCGHKFCSSETKDVFASSEFFFLPVHKCCFPNYISQFIATMKAMFTRFHCCSIKMFPSNTKQTASDTPCRLHSWHLAVFETPWRSVD